MPHTQVAPSTSNQNQSSKIDRLLDLHEVERLTSYKRSSILNKEKEGSFPKKIKLGARKIAWLESDIQIWINSFTPVNNQLGREV